MKKIEAVIRPSRLDTVRQALDKIGIKGLSVIDIDGYGNQKGITEVYRGQEYSVYFNKKVKIEIFTKDDKVDLIVEAIMSNCRTGKIGDGKIFVIPISEVYRIRTGEKGPYAL